MEQNKYVNNYCDKQMEVFVHTLVGLINEARTSPAKYAENLSHELTPYFHADQLNYYNKSIQTFEGAQILKDFNEYMQKTPASSYLTLSNALCKAAQQIAEEKGTSGRVDHQSPKELYNKITANATTDGKLGELIALKANSSQEISTYFLLDDGLATRKRRRMLLDNEYQYIGVGTAYHTAYEVITVIILAQKLHELSAEEKHLQDLQKSNTNNMAASSSRLQPTVTSSKAAQRTSYQDY